MNSLEQKLTDAETALKEANRLYQVLFNAYLNLPSGTSERDEAKAEKVKNDAERVVIRIQARIDQILKEKELSQGKFIFPFLTLSN
jgi:hypothetical protein